MPFSRNTSRFECSKHGQYTSVELGTFLPSAGGAELKVRRDNDRWSLLHSTKSRCGRLRLIFLLSVETSPSFLEVVRWDFHSLQVGTASELILGLHDLFQSILPYRLRLGMWNVPPFLDVISPATNYSPFQILPATTAYPKKSPVNTFWPNWWSLDWSRATTAPRRIIGSFNGSPNRVE